jgi:hypothetical protein
MHPLKLFAFGTLASFAISIPVQAQTESAPSESTDISQSAEQLPPDLTEPLEVGQPQADEFFAAPRRELPANNPTGSGAVQERLIQPPPGTQTPGQLTPEQRLNISID